MALTEKVKALHKARYHGTIKVKTRILKGDKARCTRCKKIRRLNKFYLKRSGEPRTWCKECNSKWSSDKWKSRPGFKERRLLAQRKWMLKAFYGMSLEDYEALFDGQGGVCAICKTASTCIPNSPYLCVDHCHTTNRIRGLLCGNCNNMLGGSKDTIAILEAGIEYLRKNSGY